MNRFRGYLKILLAMGLRGIFKTLYLNFRVLPFCTAIHLPLYCTAYTRLHSLSGRVTFDCPVRHGLVKFGFLATDMFVPGNNVTLLCIDGELCFGGRGDFAPGVAIQIRKQAKLSIGKEFFISSQTRFVCHEHIYVGDWSRIAWESQIIDTNFHYIQDLSTGAYLKKTKPIHIGHNVWIGNRTTVARGTVIPDFCIVASNSLCSKDYSQIPDDSIIGGIPAKLLKSGYRRVASYVEEEKITRELC